MMKKCIVKNVIFLLLVGIVLPAYAIDFNEPRKVLLPKYSNAVYRDLTVLDTMYLDATGTYTYSGKPRRFFLEIGKRPSYFWNENHRHHLQQVQHLTFDNIQFNNTASTLTIQNMEVSEGAFIGQNFTLDINNQPNLKIYGNDTSFLMDNINFEFPLILSLPTNRIIDLTLSSMIFENWYRQVDPQHYSIKNLYLRDLNLLDVGDNEVPFPSPRMMIQCKNCGTDSESYKVKGTSLNFKWDTTPTPNTLKNYYGPWENYGSVSASPCPAIPQSGSPQEDRCYTIVQNNNRETRYVYDQNSSTFTCAGRTAEGAFGLNTITYDPTVDYCYDYQEIIPSFGSGADNKDRNFNNNQGVYEFVVQEVFAYKNDTAIPYNQRLTFLDQSPEVRSLDGKIIPLTNSTNTAVNTWEIYKGNANTVMRINGQNITVNGGNIIISQSFSSDLRSLNPCYVICKNTTCDKDYFYIKERTVRHIQDGIGIQNHWPGEVKQDMVLISYVVGYCPNQSSLSGQYADHEINWEQPANGWKNLESLLSETYKVCIKRKVMCNRLNETNEQETNYQNKRYFTTDY